MLSLKKACGAGLVLLLAALPTAGPAQPPDDITLVDDLIVRAYGGPPWWRVSDGDTTIYVLASPMSLPPGMTFEQGQLEKRLTGANELILAGGTQRIPLSQRAAIDQLTRELNHNSKTDLEPSLPPAVRVRFVAAREAIGQPATRYGALPPGMAGMALAGDIDVARLAKAPAERDGSVEQIVALRAQAKRVRITPLGFGIPSFAEFRSAGLPCLVAVLDDIEKPKTGAGAWERDRETVVRAWAEGDIRPTLDQLRKDPATRSPQFTLHQNSRKGPVHMVVRGEACTAGSPTYNRLRGTVVTSFTDAVRKALRKPGHAVAVIPGPPLLQQGGILDQLRREGFTVSTPDQD